MKNLAMTIEYLEDSRAVMLATSMGGAGTILALNYAARLFWLAVDSYERADISQAIELAKCEYRFNLRIFGARHRYTQSSLAALRALARHTPPALALVSDRANDLPWSA